MRDLRAAVALFLAGGVACQPGGFGAGDQGVVPPTHDADLIGHTIPGTMVAGERRLVTVTMRNSGATSADDWAANRYFLYSRMAPENLFVTYVGAPLATDTAIGASTTFSFVITAPNRPGETLDFRASMYLASEGFFGDLLSVPVTILAEGAQPRMFDCAIVADTLPATILRDVLRAATITVRNTGSATWTPDMCLYSRDDTGTPSNLVLWRTNVCIPLGTTVAPGDTHTFDLTLRGPLDLGTYTFRRQMFASSVGLIRGDAFCVDETIDVVPGLPELISAPLTHNFPTTIQAGAEFDVAVFMRNLGTETWLANGNYLLYSLNQPITQWGQTIGMVEADTPPNQVATIRFRIRAPAAGNHAHQWRMFKGSGATAGFFGNAIFESVTVIPESQPLPALPMLFTSDRDGNDEIYSMNDDGTGLVRLTNHAAVDYAPVWSPDGSRIVFVSERDGNREIYTMNASGGDLRNLTSSADLDEMPSWSPDGARIAWGSGPGNAEIWVMNADGSNKVRLTTNLDVDDEPSWSRDGTRLYFETDRNGSTTNYDIYVMNVDGSGQTNLTPDNPGWDIDPKVSPDGLRVVFASDRDGDLEIWSMRTDGTDLRQLTQNTGRDYSPSWSRDGRLIAFVSEQAGDTEVFVMSPDGSNLRRVTTRAGRDWFPALR